MFDNRSSNASFIELKSKDPKLPLCHLLFHASLAVALDRTMTTWGGELAGRRLQEEANRAASGGRPVAASRGGPTATWGGTPLPRRVVATGRGRPTMTWGGQPMTTRGRRRPLPTVGQTLATKSTRVGVGLDCGVCCALFTYFQFFYWFFKFKNV
jgi:hypothetical protein